MAITKKLASYSLWRQGLLGNRVRMWDTFEGVLASGFDGLVSMRYKSHGGGWCRYEVSVADIPAVMGEWVAQGADPALITFNEDAPDRHLRIQGEVRRGPGGLELTYSVVPGLKMRTAMRDPQVARGVAALVVLQHLVDYAGVHELLALLDAYPDHVVEFGSYSRPLGAVPGRCTVVWEVRCY